MAASIPHQFYTHYTNNISNNLLGSGTDEEQENSQMLNNNANLSMMPCAGSCHDQMINSPVSVVSFAEQFGLTDCANVPAPGYYDIEPGGSYCNDLVPTFWQAAADSWGIQGNPVAVAEGEGAEVKVGRYSAEEKRERILRYLKKRNERNFNKTIKYACRKTLADRRIRVRGRFAKNCSKEPSDDQISQMLMKECDNSCLQNNSFYNDTYLQMKYDEDEVWQAAMANLVYFPYAAS